MYSRSLPGARALSEWLKKRKVAVGEVRGETLVKLMEAPVCWFKSVFMYGAEVWGVERQIGPVEWVLM